MQTVVVRLQIQQASILCVKMETKTKVLVGTGVSAAAITPVIIMMLMTGTSSDIAIPLPELMINEFLIFDNITNISYANVTINNEKSSNELKTIYYLYIDDIDLNPCNEQLNWTINQNSTNLIPITNQTKYICLKGVDTADSIGYGVTDNVIIE